jgi:hypothetical protein
MIQFWVALVGAAEVIRSRNREVRVMSSTSGRFVRIGLLAVAVVCGQAVAARAQTTLRYKFKQGEKLNYVMEQNMVMKLNVGGKESAMDVKQVMDLTWHFVAVNSDGNAKLIQRMDRIRMSMNTPKGRVELDTNDKKEPDNQAARMMAPVFNALAGADITMTMSPRGEFSDVRVPAKVTDALRSSPAASQMAEMFTSEGLKRMVSQGCPVLPKGAVTKGASWAQPLDMKLPFGKMNMKVTYTYEGPTTQAGRPLEKIGLKVHMTIEADPKAPGEIKLKGQNAKGTVLFDNVAGRVTETTMNQQMDTEVNADGVVIQQNTRQTVTMKLQNKSR